MISLFPDRQTAVSVLGFDVYWYGIMYMLAFLIGYRIALHIQAERSIRWSEDQWSHVMLWIMAAVIVGGRLGYVLLYELGAFLENPLVVFAIRTGGMSSHGGFAAVIAALFFIARRRRIDPLAFGDVIVIPVAVGLAFGRVGNFINLELYGPVTDLPWAIDIPGVEGARHPTQLYAVAKNLLIATLCTMFLYRKHPPHGQVAALFLCTYGMLRFLIEYVRVPTHDLIEIFGLTLTRGQAYSIPVFIAGIAVWIWSSKRR